MAALENRPHKTRRPEGLTPQELEANQEYYDRIFRDLQAQISNHEIRIAALE